jgi:hypothetical protein
MNWGGVFRLGVFGNLSLTISSRANTVKTIAVYLYPTKASGEPATARDPLRANQLTTAGGVKVRSPEIIPTRKAQRSSIVPPSRTKLHFDPRDRAGFRFSEVSLLLLAFDLREFGRFAPLVQIAPREKNKYIRSGQLAGKRQFPRPKMRPAAMRGDAFRDLGTRTSIRPSPPPAAMSDNP